jgi:hypothetical protein
LVEFEPCFTAGMASSETLSLSIRHGVRVQPDPSVPVEEVLLAVGDRVGRVDALRPPRWPEMRRRRRPPLIRRSDGGATPLLRQSLVEDRTPADR